MAEDFPLEMSAEQKYVSFIHNDNQGVYIPCEGLAA